MNDKKEYLFYNTMNAIKEIEDKADKFSNLIGIMASESHTPAMDFQSYLVTTSIESLCAYLNDDKSDEIQEWIEWWLYDVKAGKDAERLKATVPELNGGQPFAVKTSVDLWSIVETYLPKEKK